MRAGRLATVMNICVQKHMFATQWTRRTKRGVRPGAPPPTIRDPCEELSVRASREAYTVFSSAMYLILPREAATHN